MHHLIVFICFIVISPLIIGKSNQAHGSISTVEVLDDGDDLNPSNGRALIKQSEKTSDEVEPTTAKLTLDLPALNSLYALPTDVLLMVMSYLPLHTLVNFTSSCTYFYELGKCRQLASIWGACLNENTQRCLAKKDDHTLARAFALERYRGWKDQTFDRRSQTMFMIKFFGAIPSNVHINWAPVEEKEPKQVEQPAEAQNPMLFWIRLLGHLPPNAILPPIKPLDE